MKTASIIGATIVIALVASQAFADDELVLVQDQGPCVVPVAAGTTISVATNGDITVDVDDENLPTCFGSGGGTIDVALTVNPTTINAGDSVTVSWSVSGFVAGLTTCAATGGTAAWRSDVLGSPESGMGTYALASGPSVNFSMSCQNVGGNDAAVVTVNGGSGGGGGCNTLDPSQSGIDCFPAPPAFCGAEPPGREIPFNIKKDFAINPPDGDPKVNYRQVWGLWPGSNEAAILIPRNEYVALPFEADLPQPPEALWQMGWAGGAAGGTATTVSISRCPGDFTGIGIDDSVLSNCLVTSGSEGALIITIIGSHVSGCDLELGGSYYLNVRHTTSNGQNACPNTQCEFLGNPSRLN